MPHNLIELTQWPSMPAPWSSIDPGEAWVWEDYVALLQTKPISMVEVMAKIAKKKDMGASPMEYPFALTVFYRKDRNPHGPSSRPILVATLEQLDYTAAAKTMGSRGIDFPDMRPLGVAPTVQGMFTAETRFNLGDFQGELTRDSARKYFFDLIRRELSLEGEPVEIGAMADVHGHPNTGWPAQEKKKSGGCLSMVAAFALLITPLAIWVFINCK